MNELIYFSRNKTHVGEITTIARFRFIPASASMSGSLFPACIFSRGGGESTLVDDLLASGYTDLAVLDISRIAIDVTKARLGSRAKAVKWLEADVTQVDFAEDNYDTGMIAQRFIF